MDLAPRQLAALKARRDVTAFSRVAYLPYRHAAHLALIDAALMDVERYIRTGGTEGTGKLMIEAPPRHGKSQKVARLFVPWAMGRNPDLRVIISSHTASLSESHSRVVRNTIRSASYASIFPGVRLAEDSQARDNWDLEEPHQGGLLSVGVGSAVVGRGGGLIICDDLLASREAYESKIQRDKLWSWFTDELSTRAAPVCAFVMIGSRWGLDDPAGRLELQEADQWRVIRLPALAVEDDPLGRAEGEALWPEQYSRDNLLEKRKRLGDYSFEALYQQSPVSSNGGVFTRDKFRQIDSVAVKIEERVRFWDLAISEKKTADYTVGVLLGKTEDDRYVILDVERFRLNWQAAMDKITAVALADGPDVRIGVEQVLFSAAAVSELVKRPALHQYSVSGIEVHKDKLTRALPFAARIDAGLVDVLRRSWTQDFLDELASFPNGRHDDMVDAASSAYAMMSQHDRRVVFGPAPDWYTNWRG